MYKSFIRKILIETVYFFHSSFLNFIWRHFLISYFFVESIYMIWTFLKSKIIVLFWLWKEVYLAPFFYLFFKDNFRYNYIRLYMFIYIYIYSYMKIFSPDISYFRLFECFNNFILSNIIEINILDNNNNIFLSIIYIYFSFIALKYYNIKMIQEVITIE